MNSKLNNSNLPDQGKSESPGLGGRRVLILDSLLSSSCVGITQEDEDDIDPLSGRSGEASTNIEILTENPQHRRDQEVFSTNSDTPEDVTRILEMLLDLGNDNSFSTKRKTQLVIDTILTYVNDLSIVIDKLNSARKYIMSKVRRQDEQIKNLYDEIRHLKSLLPRNEPTADSKELGELSAPLEYLNCKDCVWMENALNSKRLDDSGRWSLSPSSKSGKKYDDPG